MKMKKNLSRKVISANVLFIILNIQDAYLQNRKTIPIVVDIELYAYDDTFYDRTLGAIIEYQRIISDYFKE